MKICWVDTETTGLDPKKNGIIQASFIIDIDCGREIERKTFFMRPHNRVEIEDRALSFSGITRDKIAGFTPENIVKREIRKLLVKYVNPYNKEDKFIFAGYNCPFDKNFFTELWIRQDDPYFYAFFFPGNLDVMGMVAEYMWLQKIEQPSSWKLGDIQKHLGIKVECGELHDASADIEITREIAYYLRNRLLSKRRLLQPEDIII